MSFLAPLFFLGGLALTLPVIFHLIRRTTRTRTMFSSLMFLRQSPPRLTRRNRLEDILLLVLRCLVLALFAAAFARPFLNRPVVADPDPRGQRRVIALLDTSGSMRRSDLWAQARTALAGLVAGLGPADQLAVWTYDRQPRTLFGFEDWSGVAAGDRTGWVQARLGSLEPGWGASHLDQAMIQAAEILAETAEEPATGARQIVVISDLQEGSRLDALQGHDWPPGVEVRIETVQSTASGNAGIGVLADASDRPASGEAESEIRVRVENSADARREQFQLVWLGAKDARLAQPPIEVHVPAGENRIVRLVAPRDGVKAEGVGLLGDDEQFDNVVYVIPPEPVESRVLYLGKEPAGDAKQPLYFLQRAYQETRRQAVRVEVSNPTQGPAVEAIAAAALVVVTDALPEGAGESLRSAIEGGKTVLAAPMNFDAGVALSRSFGIEGLSWEEAPASRYGLLGEIDFRHPLFAAFADARFSDFTKIHFWRHRRVDTTGVAEARVLARFDDGDPAWIEIPVGKGRVLWLTSGWQPSDSQLALSTKFVPLVYAMLEYAGAGTAAPRHPRVGDTLVSAVGSGVAGGRWIGPDGLELGTEAESGGEPVAGRPGVYRREGSGKVELLAVNLDPAESRTAPLGEDQLQSIGVPLAVASPRSVVIESRTSRLNAAELEGRQKLWWWFLIGTLAVVLTETWLAGRAGRQAVLEKGATA